MVSQDTGESRPLSVSAALAQAKDALESIVVTILGEVSEVSAKAGYKAVYFTVKDDRAALPCMMWNNRYQAAGVELTVGAMVEISGRFSLYTAKGRMNFEVFSLALAGEGRLRMAVAALASRLQGEGLMDAARKRALPEYPETIGIVTSPRGAAVRDMLRTLRRRYPLARVLVAGVPVEGTAAPAGMIEALEKLAQAGADVILLGRGGGSFEDLMPFNDEALARAIAASPVPIVTGIGHEPDTSVADMVADVRASTPTAAAETVAPDKAALLGGLALLGRRLGAAADQRLSAARERLMRLALRPLFQDADALLAQRSLGLDDLGLRLNQALPARMAARRQRLAVLDAALRGELRHALDGPANATAAMNDRWRVIGKRLLGRFSAPLVALEASLRTLSPLAVLTRGYAIARTKRGRILRSVQGIKPKETIVVSLADGEVVTTVEGIEARLPGAEFALTYDEGESHG